MKGSDGRVSGADEGAHGALRRAGEPRLWLARPLAGVASEPAQALAQVFALANDSSLRSVKGRATLPWPADGRVIVKRYERGVAADAWRDWRERGAVRSFARREAENLAELAQLGLPTPRPLGWCGSDGWLGVRSASALWMERVAHTVTLREELARDRGAAQRWRDELAGHAARLHAADWRHRDFYLQHWLVTEHGLVLIDVGRCERQSGMRERWFIKDIAALAMSCPPSVPPCSRLRFAARYFAARGLVRRAHKREFLTAVLAKAARMAAHEPRYVDAREFGAQARPEA